MNQVIVHFCDHAERPEQLDFGFFQRNVRDFTLAPPRCFACQKFAHTAKHCLKQVVVCSICSGSHHYKECPPNTPPKYANCAGAHATNAQLCPTRLEAIRRARLFVTGLTSERKGRSKVTSSNTSPDGVTHRGRSKCDLVSTPKPTRKPSTSTTTTLTFAQAVATANGVPSDQIRAILASRSA